MSSKDSHHFQTGLSEPFSWNHPAGTRLCLESSPTAERVSGELPPGTSSLSVAELGPSALWGCLTHMADFLPASPPRLCRCSWWLSNPLCSLSGMAGPSLPPSHTSSPHWPRITSAQPEAAERHQQTCLLLLPSSSSSPSPTAFFPPLSTHSSQGRAQTRGTHRRLFQTPRYSPASCLCCQTGTVTQARVQSSSKAA